MGGEATYVLLGVAVARMPRSFSLKGIQYASSLAEPNTVTTKRYSQQYLWYLDEYHPIACKQRLLVAPWSYIQLHHTSEQHGKTPVASVDGQSTPKTAGGY